MAAKLAFASWLNIVDVNLEQRIGMDSAMLEDWNWRDAWDDGLSPSEAINAFCDDRPEYEPFLATEM